MSRGAPAARPKRERTYPAVPEVPPPTPRATLRIADGKARATVQVPKRQYVRSPKLREAYRLIPCQFDRDDDMGLCAVSLGVCACHSNWAVHGKGKSIKACDTRCASGCADHHRELDQGSRWSEEQKKSRFWRAHVRSVRLLVSLGHWPAHVAVPDVEHCPWDGA